MKRFAALFAELDATTSTNAKVEALQRYFAQAPAHDAAWVVDQVPQYVERLGGERHTCAGTPQAVVLCIKAE